MKKYLVSNLLMLTFAFGAKAGMNIDKVFIPEGFDKNDVAQVVVHGHFSDGCYQLDQENVTVNEEKKTVTVDLKYHHRSGAMCIQIISPFTKTIGLGRLGVGKYQINVVGSPEEGVLTIKTTNTERTDDYIYAPVEFTDVAKLSSGSLSITLKGRYPLQKRGCMRLVNTIASNIKNGVLVVQPIAELKDDTYCNAHPADQNFEQVITVPRSEEGLTLLYFRVLNGESYSRVFDLN